MITKEEVLRIAKIAKLSVKDDEIDLLIKDMSTVIEYADLINSVVEDQDNEFGDINNIYNAFNEDIVVDSYDRDEILKNREGGENGYFVVRKSLRG
ncbi:MAG TPA: aspartyl/glutamyl-tRNA amidotransferase subunit C [Sedimentibacter sp.]|nr:Asp-tRNA(Asn)/Glu-tRNA(Gln) amidotransferase subunit GatC [Sedimentibacter sp.]HNZ83022.1 aspartyl/glutamyl-tRNA amidotransferase subunit C [Sedimentibacter sp.]HOH69418.1 aspartyl/glutamyl-tRNA amidotransferase subunit C [Sedimentibacter sp.]HQB63477.1 aspartyl/glutamyl-tRNA amidotransferase subunit C [Sedimentibacter sp.]